MEGGIEDMAITKNEVKTPVAGVQWRTATSYACRPII